MSREFNPELVFKELTPSEAYAVKDRVKEGQFISVRNLSNLSESYVYERTSFNLKPVSKSSRMSDMIDVSMKESGVSSDDWYMRNASSDVFYISDVSDLLGFSALVSYGVDFEGKTIKLSQDIDMEGLDWLPIGRGQASNSPFRGTFDGNGYGIYNLHKDLDDNYPFEDFAFFDSLDKATIKELCFENVTINDSRVRKGSVAVIAVNANETTFGSIFISGSLAGSSGASIAIRACDSSFYNCINRANISIAPLDTREYLDESGNRIVEMYESVVCGGLVASIALSEDVKKDIPDERYVCLFSKCLQEGMVTVTINQFVYSVVIGQMYGRFEKYDESEHVASVLIDRCMARNNCVSAPNPDDIFISEFFAKVNSASYGSNYYNPNDNCKIDMLDGLIGMTPESVSIVVVKTTSSLSVKGMVIPGSVNTLKSKHHESTFLTEKSEPLNPIDGMVNLMPYFRPAHQKIIQ